MEQKEVRTPRGLYTHPSKIAVPEGALLQAENCYIYREGIVSKRRGFTRYGTTLASPANQLLLFQSSKLLHLPASSDLAYDSDDLGTWVNYALTVDPPSTGLRLPWLEQNLNLYFGAETGVYTTDALTTEPVKAGTPPGLDLTASKVGTGDGFMPPDTSLGYRLTYTHEDANSNVKEGYPSFPEIVSNALNVDAAWTRVTTTATVTLVAHGYSVSDTVTITDSDDPLTIPDGPYTVQTTPTADTFTITVVNTGAASGVLTVGKAFNISLVFTLPDGLVAGDTYRIYRTALSGASTDPAGDDMQEIISGKLTSADLAAGSVTVVDTYDDAFRGVRLYSGPNAEGPSQANSRPPWCELMASYKGHTFYAVYRSEEALQLQLLGTAALVAATSSITFDLAGDDRTYTADTAENAGTHTFKVYTALPTEAENVRETAKSLVRVINQDSGNTWFYAFYNSTETDPPGKILVQTRGVNTGTFQVWVNDDATTGISFSPAIPEDAQSPNLTSDSSYSPNGMRRSKFQQPEAVPSLNTNKAGAANKKILGLVALKDVLLIFKEDGVFTLSGNSDGAGGFAFTVDELDPTIILNAPASLATVDSAAYCVTPQGVVRVTQGGASIISRQIEDDLRRIFHFTDYRLLTHAASYESEHLYLLFTQRLTTDEVAEIAWGYNTVTQSWTQYILKPVSAAIVNPSEDVLYMAHGVDTFVLQERKTLTKTGNDYADENVPCTVTAVNTVVAENGQNTTAVTVTFDYTETPAEGWGFEKGSFFANVVVANKVATQTFILTLNKYKPSLTTGAAFLSLPVRMAVKWAPLDFAMQGAMKQFPFMTFTVEGTGGHHRIGAHSDLNGQPEYLNTIQFVGGFGWGQFAWGLEPWGNPGSGSLTLIRTWIPKNHQRARAFSPIYINEYIREGVHLCAVTLDHRPVGKRPERQP